MPRHDPYSLRKLEFMRRLRGGPDVARKGDIPAPHDCLYWGWVDWVRDSQGRVIYGDRRYQLTDAGRAKLEQWESEGRGNGKANAGIDAV